MKLSVFSDIDECSSEDNSPCHSDAFCDNTVGSFICTCRFGFTGDGSSCDGKWVNPNCHPINPSVPFLDIDECVLNIDECDANAVCVNDRGSYSCNCAVGFSGNGFNCSGIFPKRCIQYCIMNVIHFRC